MHLHKKLLECKDKFFSLKLYISITPAGGNTSMKKQVVCGFGNIT